MEMPPLTESVGSMSGFLSMPWSLALSAERMKLATLRPGIAVGYWKARNRPSRARLSGDSFEDVAALPDDLAALDDVGRVAHQRVGEGRLARAVRAHDRVDLALADGQVDPLEDLVVGVGDGRDAQAADDEVLVGAVGLVGHGSVRAPGVRGRRRGCDGDRGRVGGTRSARVIESRAPATASRTRTHRTLTVQRDERSHRIACSGSSLAQIIGAIGPSSARRTSPIGIVSGGRGELVAAMRAAGARHEAGLAQADDELLEVGPREVLLGGDLGEADAGPLP